MGKVGLTKRFCVSNHAGPSVRGELVSEVNASNHSQASITEGLHVVSQHRKHAAPTPSEDKLAFHSHKKKRVPQTAMLDTPKFLTNKLWVNLSASRGYCRGSSPFRHSRLTPTAQ